MLGVCLLAFCARVFHPLKSHRFSLFSPLRTTTDWDCTCSGGGATHSPHSLNIADAPRSLFPPNGTRNLEDRLRSTVLVTEIPTFRVTRSGAWRSVYWPVIGAVCFLDNEWYCGNAWHRLMVCAMPGGCAVDHGAHPPPRLRAQGQGSRVS